MVGRESLGMRTFVVRIAAAAAGSRVCGVVDEPVTGQRRVFRDAAELIAVLSAEHDAEMSTPGPERTLGRVNGTQG